MQSEDSVTRGIRKSVGSLWKQGLDGVAQTGVKL